MNLNVVFLVLRPFIPPPELRIEFTHNGTRRSFGLRLPIVATRFISPFEMQPQAFASTWQKIPDAKQARQVFSAAGSIALPQIKALIARGLRFSVLPPTQNQYVIQAAGSFKTSTKQQQTGQLLSVGCLVQLECNPNQNKYRVTAKAHHPDVAKAVVKVLFNQLNNVDLTPGGPGARDGPYDGGESLL